MKEFLMFVLFIFSASPVFAQPIQTNPHSILLIPPVERSVGSCPVSVFASDSDEGGDFYLAMASEVNHKPSILINPLINPGVCGNVNGDGLVNFSDIVYLINYVFLQGPAPVDNSGDINGDNWVDGGDALYLDAYLGGSGDPPIGYPGECTSPYPDTFDLDTGVRDTLRVATIDANPGENVEMPVICYNDDSLSGFAVALKISEGSPVHLDSVSWLNSKAIHLSNKGVTLSPDSVLIWALATGTSRAIAPGTGPLATLWLHAQRSTDKRLVSLDTIYWQPSRPPRFYRDTQHFWGYKPQFVALPLSRPDTLSIVAYSPVDLIVTDPANDSIGVSFNTIQDADYDTTVDVNYDGDKDDLVTIPHPFVGEYQIRVIRESEVGPEDSVYSLGIRIDGTAQVLLADNAPVPQPDESDIFSYDCLPHLRGDTNGDNQITVSDVVFLINYLFISGPAPDPIELGDINCDENINVSDVVYIINYLFISGPPPCS
jgi:hypothetical protein